MIKYTPSKNAWLMARQYLKHEFRKIFSDVKDEQFFKKIDKSIDGLNAREGERSFWNLVAAMSEGWKFKQVFSLLSNDQYQWKIKKIPLAKVHLGSLSATLDKYLIKKFNYQLEDFAGAWKKDRLMKREILATGLAAHKNRDHFPIMVFEAGDNYRVFDGARRVLLAAIGNKKSILAWVGRKIKARGKPLVSASRCYFLSNLYAQASRRDKNLEKAIVRIGREIAKNYRNGREVLVKRIVGWSHDQKVKEMFVDMLK